MKHYMYMVLYMHKTEVRKWNCSKGRKCTYYLTGVRSLQVPVTKLGIRTITIEIKVLFC